MRDAKKTHKARKTKAKAEHLAGFCSWKNRTRSKSADHVALYGLDAVNVMAKFLIREIERTKS